VCIFGDGYGINARSGSILTTTRQECSRQDTDLEAPRRTGLESVAFDLAWLPRVGPVSLGKAHWNAEATTQAD